MATQEPSGHREQVLRDARQVRDLTLDREGVLYGVSGNQGSDQHSLFEIDTASAVVTFLVVICCDQLPSAEAPSS